MQCPEEAKPEEKEVDEWVPGPGGSKLGEMENVGVRGLCSGTWQCLKLVVMMVFQSTNILEATEVYTLNE